MSEFSRVVDWRAAQVLLVRDSFTGLQKLTVQEAFDCFREVLGIAWPGWREGYPLARLFLLAPASWPHRGFRLAQAVVGALRVQSKLTRGRMKLLGSRRESDFAGALFEFETWHLLTRIGVQPRFIPEAPPRRTPDLEILLCDQRLMLELKTIQPSDQQISLNELICRTLELDAAEGPTGGLDIHFDRDALASSTRRRFGEIVETVREMKLAGIETAMIDGLGIINRIVGPRPTETISRTLQMPSTDPAERPNQVRDIRQTRRLVHDSEEKFAPHDANLLVIKLQENLSLGWRKDFPTSQETAEAVIQAMSQRPKISGLLMIEEAHMDERLGNWEDASRWNDDRWLAWSVKDGRGWFRSGMLIASPSATRALTSREVASIVRVARLL